ncbi:MAG TPA: hypothetical protein VFW89_07590 [Gemmatimonadaceae bacterium]|nr:hypothetical protein [Gemmatimonadaceae bacterium]
MSAMMAPPASRPAAARPLGVAAGPPTPASGSLHLAAEHFVASMVFLLAGAVGLVWIAPELSAGLYPSPHVAGITHLFTLGWITTTIFGALSQLLPVALGAPLRSERLGHASFWLFVPGVALFATGVATGRLALDHAGIALVTLGILLVVTNIGASLPRARLRDATWAAIPIALFFLFSTLSLGVVLLHNLHTGFIAALRLRMLAAHLHIALLGWVLIMIVGVSHRLLPMFLLAHGANTKWTARALMLLAPGVAMLATGLATGSTWAGWTGVVLVEGGVACFLTQAVCFYRARIRRTIDVGMQFVRVALGFLVVGALLGPLVLASGAAHAQLATAYITVGLLGAIVLYVSGFFYKIVPLLAWTTRFRGRMGKGPVPTVAQLYSARIAQVQLVLMTLGVVGLASGELAGSAHVTRCGAVLFLAGTMIFMGQIVHIATGKHQ